MPKEADQWLRHEPDLESSNLPHEGISGPADVLARRKEVRRMRAAQAIETAEVDATSALVQREHVFDQELPTIV